jgi:hypothetical protein
MVEQNACAAERITMTVVWVIVGVVGVLGLAAAAARWATGQSSAAVKREAERGVQQLERFLADAL